MIINLKFKNILFLVIIFGYLPTNGFAQTPYIPVKGSAWQLAIADITGDEKKELIYGTFDGAVRCQDLTTGQLLWEVSTDAFLFKIAAQDIDYDGKAEIFAAAADGGLYAIAPDGQLLWTFRSQLPLYDVAVGDIEKGGYLEIVTGGIDGQVYVLSSSGALIAQSEVSRFVHRLATGDLDHDGSDEIFVVDVRVFASVLKLNEGKIGIWKRIPYTNTLEAWKGIPYLNWPIHLNEVWHTKMTVPKDYKNWENTRNHFFAFSIDIEDIDGNQIPEILLGDSFFNRQAVMALSAAGESLWISEKLPFSQFIGDTYSDFFSTAFVQVAEIDETAPGKEIVTVAGGLVRLLNNQGQILQQVNAKIGFTDLVIDGKIAYLGSSPNGDNTVYRIDMSRTDWVFQIQQLERQGKARQMGDNIAKIRQQVTAYQGTAPENSPVYDIRFKQVKLKPNERSYQKSRKKIQWFNEQFPFHNLRAVFMMKIMENTPPLDENGQPWSEKRWQVDAIHGTMSVEEILQAAQQIENYQIPTVFVVGHSCMPFITLSTAEKILQVAPRYTVGFVSMEDECINQLQRYLQHYFGPLADICAKYGYKKCIALNKNVWWMAAPAIKPIYDELFASERGKVIVAATEDSNSRTPEINLLARSGLWLAGLIENIQVSIISDLFSFSRFHEWEYPKHGHPYLRLLMAHTLLGGNTFGNRIMEIQSTQDAFKFSSLGRESTEIFYQMLGKGLVFSPTREQVKGFSSIGIAVHAPPEKWLQDGFNGHGPWKWQDDPELHNAIIPHNGCLWGNTQTPNHALQKVLLGKQRQFGYHIPATPYGLIAIVPAHASLDKVPGIQEWWHTDGISIWQHEAQKLTGMEAAQTLKTAFEKAATQLPFHAKESIFLQTIKLDDKKYRLFAIDPGWLDPKDHEITIQVQIDKKISVTDALSGENITLINNALQITVPAGVFRIFDVIIH